MRTKSKQIHCAHNIRCTNTMSNVHTSAKTSCEEKHTCTRTYKCANSQRNAGATASPEQQAATSKIADTIHRSCFNYNCFALHILNLQILACQIMPNRLKHMDYLASITSPMCTWNEHGAAHNSCLESYMRLFIESNRRAPCQNKR